MLLPCSCPATHWEWRFNGVDFAAAAVFLVDNKNGLTKRKNFLAASLQLGILNTLLHYCGCM